MDFGNDLLENMFSYILGAVSVIGFLIVAHDEIMLRVDQLLGKQRLARTAAAGADYKKPAPRDPDLANILGPDEKVPILLGLIFMGVIVSAAVFLMHTKVEQLALNINLNVFLIILLAFTMLPG